MKSLCSCVLLVVFLTSFPLSITRATVNEVSHEATQNFQKLFDFVTVDPSSGDHDFAVSKSMVTWGDLVEFLNETQQGELYTPEMNSFITRSLAGTSSSQVSYAINADHPEYEGEPAICSIDTAKRYCNYKEVSFERQLNQHDGEQDHVGQATSQAYFHLLSTTQYQQWKAASSQSFDALKSDDRCEWIENDAVDAEPVPQLLQHGSEPQLFPSQGDHVGGFRLVVDKGLLQKNSTRTGLEESQKKNNNKENVPEKATLLGSTNVDVSVNEGKAWKDDLTYAIVCGVLAALLLPFAFTGPATFNLFIFLASGAVGYGLAGVVSLLINR